MPGFDDILGQNQIRDHFINAIKEDKVSHAYIITGEKYSGKEFISRIFAAALLCDSEDNKPCGKCHSCVQALTDNNPDIIFVTHEKPNVISVDDIREQVNKDVNIKPYGGKRKIYIINEAEKMNQQAQNAILKTFEEPPEYAVILLLTTNLEVLLPTIKSRAVILTMKAVPDNIVKKYLMETKQIPDYKADTCVAFARGNIGKAALLADSEDFENTKNDVMQVLKHIYDMEVADLTAVVKKASDYKNDINDYFDMIVVFYRDILMYKSTGKSNNLIFLEELQYIKKVAEKISYENIQRVFDAIDLAKRRLTSNVNFELTIELMYLTISQEIGDGND